MLLVFSLIVVSTSIGFFVGLTVGVHHFAVAIVGAWFILYYMSKKNVKQTTVALVTAVVLILLFSLLSSRVYDVTWDGAAYHKQAIGLLYEGWNPVYQSAQYYESLVKTGPYMASNPLLWAETYPKATWYFAGTIYKLFDNIEAGKSYTLIFSFIAAGYFYDYCRKKKIKTFHSIIIALLTALNPISMAQMQGYYLDGLVCSLIMCLLLAMIKSFDEEVCDSQRKDFFIIIPSLLVVGCNLKFSILLLCVIYCGVYAVMLWRNNGCQYPMAKKALSGTLTLAVAGVFATFVVGASPYITNYLRYQNIFGSFTDLLTSTTAVDNTGLSGMSNFQLLLASIFGKLSHGEYKTLGELLKLPFTIDPREMTYYWIPDARMGGMGVFYSGIFILTAILIGITVWSALKNNEKPKISGMLYIALGIATAAYVCLLPLTHQMRYIGFIWFFTVFPITIFFSRIQNKKQYRAVLAGEITSVLLFAAIMVNIAPWFYVAVKRTNTSADTTATLQGLRDMELEEDQLQISLYCKDFTGIHYNLENDFGLDYNYVEYEDIPALGGFSATYSDWVFYRILDGE